MELTQIPKIELHLHLDGAVPPETMWRMAQEKGLALPADTLEDFRTWLVRTADCRDVNTYLARFELPLQLMQDAPSIERITFDVLSTLARQGHVYDEVRFAPQLHTRQDLCQQDAIEAVLAGRARALRAFPDYRCGILLCCMCIGPETVNMQENLQTVRLTRQYLGSGVVGLDLAGAEGIVPLENFHPIFDLARELSLPFTCHAGDSQGPETVRAALDFGAKRIGHGHHIYDDPTLWPRAIRQGVTRGDLPDEQHPVQDPALLRPASGQAAAGRRSARDHQHGQYDARRRHAGGRIPPLRDADGLHRGRPADHGPLCAGRGVFAGGREARDRWKILISNKYSNIS